MNILRKLFVSTFFSFLFVLVFSAFLQSSGQIKEACAASIGAGQQCPSGITNPYDHDVEAVNVNVKINVTVGTMQPGSSVHIQAKFNDARTSECYVNCLLREESADISWSGSIDHNFDNLGCSSGTCDDTLTVNVSTGDSNCHIDNSSQSQQANANGASVSYVFNVTCEALLPTIPPLTCNCSYTKPCTMPNGASGTQRCGGTTTGGSCAASSACPANSTNCEACIPALTPIPTSLPTLTPTPTRVPVCSADCTNRPSACQGAWDGCNFCNPTSNKCEVPQGQPTNTPVPTQGPTATSVPGTPTPTPTIGVPACNTPCSGPRECEGARNGCTVCLPNRGGAKVCQTQPTPTPLPFDKNACACDGLDTPGVFIGTPTTFTAYSKLVGTGANIGMQKFITFYMYKQDPAKPNETGTLIGGPADVNSVLVSNTSSPTRYRSQWLFTDTSKLEKNVTYMVYADTKKGCVQKQTAYNFEIPTQVVLAAETQQVSFFDKIQGFIARLLANFGIGGQTQQPAPTPTPIPPTATPTPNRTQGGNLKLVPFYPANILEKSCQVIRFQLPG